MHRLNTRDMVLCALFVALIVVGAFIRIPIPVVPFTLQLEFVLLSGLLLGGKLGAASVLIYIAMGLLGLPVFAQGGGLSYVLKPTFGYIMGFAVAAYVAGRIANARSDPGYGRLLVASFVGFFIIYGCGMVYYALISGLYLGRPIGLWPLILYCFLMTAPGDVALCLLGAALAKRLIPILRKSERKGA